MLVWGLDMFSVFRVTILFRLVRTASVGMFVREQGRRPTISDGVPRSPVQSTAEYYGFRFGQSVFLPPRHFYFERGLQPESGVSVPSTDAKEPHGSVI